MKNKNYKTVKVSLFLLLTFTFSLSTVIAQSPNAIKYQAVARDASGDVIANQNVNLTISILQSSVTGTEVFTETHDSTTNAYGLVSLYIGAGNPIDFANIDWANGPYFVKVVMDGNVVGTSQLLSVPYALYAETAGSSDVVLTDTSASNEIQMLSISNDTLYLENGGYVVLPDTASYAMVAGLTNNAVYADTAQTAQTFNKLTSKGTEVCNAASEGIMRYNATNKEVEYCNGTNWIVLGGGLSVSIPTLTTDAITSITNSSAISGGEVSDNGSAEIIEKGVCWNTNGTPTTSDDKTLQGTGSTSYSSNLTGLTSNDVYYVRSYGTNTAGTGYGNEQIFTTLASLSTNAANSNTLTGFSAGGNITVGGGEAISARGVAYNTTGTPTTADTKTSDGTGTGSFTSSISGKPNNTKYYLRAYATNASGTNYGSEKTTATLASLTSSDQSSATTTSVTVGGDIAAGGGASITARGVAYGTGSNPDVSGTKTSNGTGTGAFTSTPSSLASNTLYHYRAYATNEGGTNYGADKTATTLANVSVTVQVDSLYEAPASFSTGGTVDAGGGESVTERGVVYGNTANPTKADNFVVAVAAGTGSFSVSLSGLATGKIYYRAYAINSGGTSYGPQYSTLIYGGGSGLTDYDGNTYGSVVIGDQEWMTSNLKVTHYSDGTAIPLVTDNTVWVNLGDNNTDKAYCWYNNDAATNKDLYGALYTYAAATNGDNSGSNVQGVCPTGWHLPSDAEWTVLENVLGGSSVAGGNLKATSGWHSGSNGTDAIGFSALPGGRCNHGLFQFAGTMGNWWSSTESNASYALYRNIFNLRDNNSEVSRNEYSKSTGFSVRCLRD